MLKEYMQPLNIKKLYYFNVWLCVKRKSERGKRKKIILFIILLGSLYYFIELYVKIKIEMYSEL